MLKQEDINIIIESRKEQFEFIKQFLKEHSKGVALLSDNLDVRLALKRGQLTVVCKKY